MKGALLQFLYSGVAVLAAGVLLARSADKLAAATGLGKAFVGMLLLAGATSLPELTVDLSAVRRGSPDLAAGDLLGSSLVNLLILAVLDASGISREKSLGPSARTYSASALLGALMTAWIGFGLMSGLRWEFTGAGFFSWAAAALFLSGLRAVKRPAEEREGKRPGWRAPAAGYAAGAAIIFWAGPQLAEAAEKLAEATGLGQTFIGTTALALATGLPEVVSTLTAYRIGSPALAVGNIFGSNAFNMVIFLPLDLAHDGPLMMAVEKKHALTAFAVVIVSVAIPFLQLARDSQPRRYFDPASLGVIALILGLLALLK